MYPSFCWLFHGGSSVKAILCLYVGYCNCDFVSCHWLFLVSSVFFVFFLFFFVPWEVYSLYLDRAVQKCDFGHMQTAKAQTSLGIHVVWSGPSLSAYRIIRYYKECTNKEQIPGWDFAHVWDEYDSMQFGHAWRHIFTWHGPFMSHRF